MHYSRVCGDNGVKKPTALPVLRKYSKHNYVQYIKTIMLMVYVFTNCTSYRLF